MADTVRYFMEGMVPELDDLEEHGLFSRQELRAVVRKREAFEYALKRKLPAKADFLRYVEHERAMGELLQLRKARLGIREDTRGEASITRRCHTVFERATRRFRGDLRLWLAWLEFCKASGSSRQMSKVLTQALQLHPREPGLWAYAAAWEWEANANATLARSLMQQGLRACGASQQLWLDYLRLELTYAQKLSKRREVLGIGPAAAAAAANEGAGAAGEPAAEDAMAAVVNGAVASVVARQAAAQFPADVAFRRQLLAALEGFSFGGVAAIAAAILAGVEADCGGSEDAWDLCARRASGSAAGSSGKQGLEAAEALFEQGLAALPTARMFELYGAYLQEQAGDGGEAEAPQPLTGRRRKAAKRALELYARAAAAGALSEAAALAWPPLALRRGKASQALQAAALGTAAHPASARLWLQRIPLAAQQAAAQGAAGERGAGQAGLAALVAEAAAAVPQERAGEVWLAGLRALGQAGGLPAAALEGLERALAGRRKAAPHDALGAAAAEAVRQLWAQQGPAAARSCYRRLLRLPPPGAALVHAVLDLELAESQAALPRGQLQAVFEAGVGAYGSADTRLWLRFARWAQAAGGGSGSVYWRATRELADPEAFVRQMAEPEAGAEQSGAESDSEPGSESGSEAGPQ